VAPKGDISDEIDTDATINILVRGVKIVYGGAESVRASCGPPSSFGNAGVPGDDCVLSSRMGIVASSGFSLLSEPSAMIEDVAIDPSVHFRSNEGVTLKSPLEVNYPHAECRSC